MVRVPWRRGPSPEEADRLVAVAEELTMLNGPGPGANQAAVRAVDAARRLAVQGDRADRGRLLRALGRLGVNLAMGRTPEDARPIVDEVVTLARELIAETGPDDPVRAEAVIRLVQSAQIVESAGGRARGRDMVAEALAAAPPAGRGRAAVLAALVQNRLVDQEERIAQGQPVDGTETMRLAVELVDAARAVAREEEGSAVYDLAEALSFLGRAAVVVGRPDLTGAAWAEQVSILMSFDGGGAQARFAQATEAIAALGKAYPQVEVVIPGPDAWRRTPSFAGRWDEADAVPVDGLADLDGRLDRAIAMSRGGARLSEAEALLDRLVADATVAETAARGTPEHAEFQRVLARALWRLGQVRHAAGRPSAALQPARLSVAFATARLDRLTAGTNQEEPGGGTPVRHPGVDGGTAGGGPAEIVAGDEAGGTVAGGAAPKRPGGRETDGVAASRRGAEATGAARAQALEHLIVYLCDAGEIAVAAGHPDERVTLLTEAIRRGEHAGEEPVRRAVGTALHNLANAHAATLSRGTRPPPLMAETTALADRARTLRAALATEADPLTVWEYANTLVMCVGVAALDQRWADGVAHLSEVAPLLARLGPAAAEMTERAGMHAQLMRMAAPQTVEQARAAGRWPY
ncbi:hypothetical protein J2S43_002976 [Catenuloplanes nepalensis]|uniref:Uncharacterized protein n=1 Tax=Catenuloplanes nepalensis TaxID=587533 RepID=A0ABT9MSU8_9ACTN|nr:hypothetical protein [Catenuloplanes nepalensis]MDP9794464.1 hypothetical protein [Catenuloplanes nepalensis]